MYRENVEKMRNFGKQKAGAKVLLSAIAKNVLTRRKFSPISSRRHFYGYLVLIMPPSGKKKAK